MQTPSPSPGEMIHAARERMRWSLDDLAGQTKLSRSRLEALERDDFGALLDPVYVRGYYRKCAKVLELSEPVLIAAYEARVAPKTTLPPAKLRLASGTELGSSSRVPVALAIGLAVLAIAACGFIWLARAPAPQAPAPVTPVAVEALEAVASTPLANPPVTEAVPPAATTADAGSPSPAAPAPAPADAGGIGATPAAAVGATEPAPAAVASGSGMVQLRFEADSWARIDDASGRMLMNGLIRAGTERRVGGPLPLSVFLGNAPGVIVEFEGRVVDIGPWRRDNATARFTLPLASD